MSQFHKFNFHVNRTGDDVLDAIRRLKPRVIKSMESNIDFWKKVREFHPDVFLIGRDFVPQDEQNRFVNDPKRIGRAYAEKVLGLEANNTHRGRSAVVAGQPCIRRPGQSAHPLQQGRGHSTAHPRRQFCVQFPGIRAGCAGCAMWASRPSSCAQGKCGSIMCRKDCGMMCGLWGRCWGRSRRQAHFLGSVDISFELNQSSSKRDENEIATVQLYDVIVPPGRRTLQQLYPFSNVNFKCQQDLVQIWQMFC